MLRLFLKNLLFTLVVPAGVGVYWPLAQAWEPGVGLPWPPGSWALLGWLPLALGAAVYGWCLWDFVRIGRATPFPLDPPRALVVRGLYRFLRNPMYVGVLLLIAGWTVLFQSRQLLLYGLAVATVFHLVVVLYEEPGLRRRFGEPYGRYCQTVRRWLPRLP
jgi:protein-S-isoprenylcysteine O-methyltransferase Ste14